MIPELTAHAHREIALRVGRVNAIVRRDREELVRSRMVVRARMSGCCVASTHNPLRLTGSGCALAHASEVSAKTGHCPSMAGVQEVSLCSHIATQIDQRCSFFSDPDLVPASDGRKA